MYYFYNGLARILLHPRFWLIWGTNIKTDVANRRHITRNMTEIKKCNFSYTLNTFCDYSTNRIFFRHLQCLLSGWHIMLFDCQYKSNVFIVCFLRSCGRTDRQTTKKKNNKLFVSQILRCLAVCTRRIVTQHSLRYVTHRTSSNKTLQIRNVLPAACVFLPL